MSPDLFDQFDIRTSASEEQWADIVDCIETEDWKTNDHSTTELLPTLPSTRIVMAVRKSDDTFVSVVVWNEVDDIAMIGYYLTKKGDRGKGLGSLVWRHAMECIDTEKYTVVLRTGPDMAPKYQKQDLGCVGKKFFRFNASAEKYIDVFTQLLSKGANKSDSNNNPSVVTKCVNSLTIPEFDSLLDYDQKVTGRDRSDFLDSFFSLENVRACVTQTSSGEVNGFGAIVSTLKAEKHLYRLAPIYASDMNTAASIALALIKKIHSEDAKASIVIQTLQDSSGFAFLHKALADYGSLEPVEDGITLSSRKLPVTLRLHLCFVPHNNCGHFDA